VRGELTDPFIVVFAVNVNILIWDISVVPADCGGVKEHADASPSSGRRVATGVESSSGNAELGVSG
jgi:hypothetical protein